MKENLPYHTRLLRHMETVREHRSLVRRNCFACGLYSQGLKHDLSKYSPSEFFVSVRFFQGYRSPYMKEKELYGFSEGWLHHKGHNPHHWEYWYDMIDGKWQPIRMPYRYIVEMVCDRVAACRVYLKDKYTSASALEYYMSRNDKLYMHPDTRDELEYILTEIKEHGEEEVFRRIRESLKNKEDHLPR